MADLFSIVAEVTLTRAVSILEEQVQLQWNFRDGLNKLRSSLDMTQAFLRDVERRQVDDEAIKIWLKQLKGVAFMANDVLDELAYEDLRRKVENNQWSKTVSNFFSLSKNPFIFTLKMAKKISSINLALENIKNEASGYGLQQNILQNVAPSSTRNQATHSVGNSSQVVGRDADITKIVDLLLGSSTQQTLSIVSIVGMGGLGKTTLAKSVCNNERTKNHFNQIMWVCVSQDFDVHRIFQEMFESLTGKTCDVNSKDVIIKEVGEKLKEKSYLLVLDDVWQEDINNWDELRGSLLGMNENKQCKGSILVTTRNGRVAILRETPKENRHHLEMLTDDECWGIIQKRACLNSSMPAEIEVIGRDIARKCAGVPLVATVIGATMCNKWDMDDWVSLRDSSRWAFSEEEVIRVLQLSFDRLHSSALKQCFVFCSIFPKNFIIQKKQLIQLWMAEGFLQQPRGSSLAFEDIGNEYFNDLLSSSLLQVAENDLQGCITGYKMHDLVHDLAQSIGSSELSDVQQQMVSNGNGILWHSFFSKSSFFHLTKDFKRLRVLNFCDATFDSLPDSIGSLKHLRYFDISGTIISRLPKCITHLYHLQTLRLLRCYSLEEVPNLKILVCLRHLCFSQKKQSPNGISGLTNLQTLPLFDVSEERSCGIGELGDLNELRGKLKLFNLQHVRNKEEAEKAKLMRKKKLDKLKYKWKYGEKDCYSDEEVLEGLEPHSNLKSLIVKYYKGTRFPSWLARRIAVGGPSSYFQPINLVKLKLICCENVENVPTLGLCPKLKFLVIEGLKKVRCIGKKFYVDDSWCDGPILLFPALETFILQDMEELEEWLIEVEPTTSIFPSLKELRIERSYKLSKVPMMHRFSSLETICFENCNELHWIGERDNGDGDGLFPSTLKVIKVKSCKNLRSIPSVEGGISFLQVLNVQECEKLCNIGETLLSSAFLREVDIWLCPSLICIPFNGGSQSLLKLQILKCEQLREIKGGLSMSKKLKELRIEDCPKLMTFVPSLDGFTSLSILDFCGCGELTSLPSGLSTCTSLENLWLVFCPKPELPEETIDSLTQLKNLYLGPYYELEDIPVLSYIHLHSSIQKMFLVGWEKISFLPYQLQHFTTLQSLILDSFHSVKALPEWLGNLTSLQYLEISKFGVLEHLPSREAMHRLSNLKKIAIKHCPLLKENFSELSKISHIPKKKIY